MKTEHIFGGINWVSANNIFGYKRKMVYGLTNVYNLDSYNTLIYNVGMNKYRKWGKESTKKELNKIKKKLGHSPEEREISYKLYKACQRHFGTFNNAKKFAKLELTLPFRQHQLQKQYKILNPNGVYYSTFIMGKENLIKFKNLINFSIERKQNKLNFMVNNYERK